MKNLLSKGIVEKITAYVVLYSKEYITKRKLLDNTLFSIHTKVVLINL